MGRAHMNSERMGFDKWEMYKLIRGQNIGPCRVPKTGRLSETNLKHYLQQYHRVYVKPVSTWGGTNVSVVEQQTASVIWTCQGQEPMSVDIATVLDHYHDVPTIVQQGIPALFYDGRPFDVRVHLQRDIQENWVYAGELVRVGRGIVSNVGISDGMVLPIETAVSALFENSDLDVFKAQLRDIGTNIGQLFVDYSFIEEVGIDLAIDKSGHFWLIEVNTNDALGGPSHELFRFLPDQTTYLEIRERSESRNLNTLQLLFEMFTETDE